MSKEKRFRLVAVHDGAGESATWGLYVEYDGEGIAELPWPQDWPERVHTVFLQDAGFKTVTA